MTRTKDKGNPLVGEYAGADDCVGGLGELQGGVFSLVRVTWCVKHTIGDSGGWWSVRNSQGALPCIFAGQDTSELEEVTTHQCSISRKIETLHSWL